MTPVAPRPLVVPFTKMSGAGNDFIVLDDRFLRFSEAELAALARRYCPRRTGVGADGVLALREPDAEGAHFRMRYLNADGSAATMCGNGARCLARFARLAGIAGTPHPDGAATLVFDTDGGRYAADVPADPHADVRLHVPSPRGFSEVRLADGEPTFAIWTGTEHAVRFVEGVGSLDLDRLGAPIRSDAAFAPTGANANFAEVLEAGGDGPARVRARTFEKGVEAETLACGTGALAVALAARLSGRVQTDRVEVEMPGGTLRVGFVLPDGATTAEAVRDLTLEGPVEVIFQGTLEVYPADLFP